MQSQRLSGAIKKVVLEARVCRLATVNSYCFPHLVPAVFVYHKNSFYIPIDKKKKNPADVRNLKRIKNIKENPNVALLVDHYSENWNELYFILVQGKAGLEDKSVLDSDIVKKLKEKYSQYNYVEITNLFIRVVPNKIIHWHNK